jgi:hypothetical protein
MNTCNEHKFSFNSNGKTIDCALENILEICSLINNSHRIIYHTNYASIKLKEYVKKELNLEGWHINNAKSHLEFTINTINKH